MTVVKAPTLEQIAQFTPSRSGRPQPYLNYGRLVQCRADIVAKFGAADRRVADIDALIARMDATGTTTPQAAAAAEQAAKPQG